MGLLLALTAFLIGSVAQAPLPTAPNSGNEPNQVLSPDQLNNIVAPIALYPDPLLGEVLAASTYPMEIAEAEQWVNDHPKWSPSKLMKEAKKQNWDPSVQGLVAFPQVLARLTQDIAFTTSLGNAFLAQQSDLMQAVQRMRSQAQARGTLHSTPQQEVTTAAQNGQAVINIEPGNPDVWYVPDYNPTYIWGPPVYGYYPPLMYPALGVGFGWGPAIDLGICFGGWGGWGWGGWGWTPDWYGGQIVMNHSFFHRYGFNHFHDDPLGTSVWAHDPAHRLGVPYANRSVAGRFAAREPTRPFGTMGATMPRAWNSPGFENRGWSANRSVFSGYHNGAATRMQSDHGFASMGMNRTFGGFGGGMRTGGTMRGGGGVGRRR